MAQYQVIENIDEQRVVGTKEMQEQLQQELQDDLSELILPAFQTTIAQALGQTPEPHKFTNTGGIRSPLAMSSGTRREARGSRTEEDAFVEVGRQFLRGAGGRFTGGGASFDVSVGSTAMTDDGSGLTLPLIVEGRRGAGTLRRRVKFWGRYGDEGPVRVTKFRHVSIPGKPEVIDDILNGDLLQQVTDKFNKHVQKWLAKDKLKGFRTKTKVTVDL